MVYLEEFELPSYEFECRFFGGQKRTCYDTFYPFDIFPEKDLEELSFEPITIFYGSNGSGKTTLINVIAEHLSASRDAAYNKAAVRDGSTATKTARSSPVTMSSTIFLM